MINVLISFVATPNQSLELFVDFNRHSAENRYDSIVRNHIVMIKGARGGDVLVQTPYVKVSIIEEHARHRSLLKHHQKIRLVLVSLYHIISYHTHSLIYSFTVTLHSIDVTCQLLNRDTRASVPDQNSRAERLKTQLAHNRMIKSSRRDARDIEIARNNALLVYIVA
jgi:hypothetical protein